MAHPRVQELLDELARRRAELREAVDAINPELLERRPAPERWSVAEVLEHLAIVEARVVDRLAAKLAEARANGIHAETETAPVMPTVDMARLLDRSRTVTAPDMLQPRGLNAAAAWAALEQSRQRFCQTLGSGDGLALGTLTMQHPALGELTLYQWIGSMAGHEARHAAQIREIGATL